LTFDDYQNIVLPVNNGGVKVNLMQICNVL